MSANDFDFNGNSYLQVHDMAMGKFAPAYANIYMAEWERNVLPKCPRRPLVYLRYLNDIFGIWPHSEEEFRQFVDILNHHHASIKVRFEIQRERLTFLDTQVFFTPRKDSSRGLATKVHFKDTDTHALLHGTSFHPRHTFRGIVKSQLIRFRIICSRPKDFEEAITTLFRALRNRGYNRTFLRKIKQEVTYPVAPPPVGSSTPAGGTVTLRTLWSERPCSPICLTCFAPFYHHSALSLIVSPPCDFHSRTSVTYLPQTSSTPSCAVTAAGSTWGRPRTR